MLGDKTEKGYPSGALEGSGSGPDHRLDMWFKTFITNKSEQFWVLGLRKKKKKPNKPTNNKKEKTKRQVFKNRMVRILFFEIKNPDH